MANTDLMLLQRVQQRDRSALAALYDAHGGTLYGLLLGLLNGDAPRAERTLEQVFLRIWNGPFTHDVAKGGAFHWFVGLARELAAAHGGGAPSTTTPMVVAEGCMAEKVLYFAWLRGWGLQRTADHLGLTMMEARAALRSALVRSPGAGAVPVEQ